MAQVHTIRVATQADAPAVTAISVEAGLSDSDESGSVATLEPMDDQHTWIVLEDRAGAIIGGAYFGPESHSDRVWNLYFLAVAQQHQGAGGGSSLVAYVEASLRQRGPDVAKLLLIETSSMESFEPTRAFYRRQGYVQEARIREYYGPGDDKIVFWKLLSTLPSLFLGG